MKGVGNEKIYVRAPRRDFYPESTTVVCVCVPYVQCKIKEVLYHGSKLALFLRQQLAPCDLHLAQRSTSDIANRKIQHETNSKLLLPVVFCY